MSLVTLESTTVQVSFAHRFPIFPLRGVSLLPHMMLELFVFEDRYRQMVETVLDQRGQIAMAVFSGEAWKDEYFGEPPIRSAVCVGQIEQHRRLPDGNYRILLHGVCRAKIVEEFPPEGDRLYREAMLQPIEPRPTPDEDLAAENHTIRELLATEPICELIAASRICEQIAQSDIPPGVLFELVTLTLLTDRVVQYRLLEEPSALKRADIIETELHKLQGMLRNAQTQAESFDLDDGIILN